MTVASNAVVGVVGGCGGVGASRFAAALAASVRGRSLLVDLDPTGGGIDVMLGIESVAGARWSGLRLAGGRLDPAVLLDGLPSWGSVSVLAADVGSMPAPEAVRQVLAAARRAGPVIVDLPRWPSQTRVAALESSDLVVLIAADDVGAVTAARSVLAGLDGAPAGVMVRGRTRSVRPVADLVGARLLGRLPAVRRRDDVSLAPSALSRSLRQVAAGVLDAVAAAAP
jgi:secretion/DNA translocation related CpaE-like protein